MHSMHALFCAPFNPAQKSKELGNSLNKLQISNLSSNKNKNDTGNLIEHGHNPWRKNLLQSVC